jgi:hypothetical protein
LNSRQPVLPSLAKLGCRGFRHSASAAGILATGTRRALYAERLLRQMTGCTSIRSVQPMLEQSALPEYNQADTITPEEPTQPVATT